jgi:23S rRNA (guanine745-N1)-methyltransferase
MMGVLYEISLISRRGAGRLTIFLKKVISMLFLCPKCKKNLIVKEGGVALCESGHAYDRSKEGYYNLLLGAAGGTHGDNAEMISARREFLSKGYYAPLADAIAEAAWRLAPAAESILDAGCGEGYYTERVYAEFSSHRGECSALINAFDISKAAVKRAAKRIPGGSFAVASSYAIPLADGSVDLIINTFSPLAAEETLRVLKPGGIFLMAIPAEEHLYELKSVIYDKPYKNEPQSTALPGFVLIEKKSIRFQMELECASDIKNLFMMTPYAYRTSAEGRARALALEELSCCADFIILAYRKN